MGWEHCGRYAGIRTAHGHTIEERLQEGFKTATVEGWRPRHFGALSEGMLGGIGRHLATLRRMDHGLRYAYRHVHLMYSHSTHNQVRAST